MAGEEFDVHDLERPDLFVLSTVLTFAETCFNESTKDVSTLHRRVYDDGEHGANVRSFGGHATALFPGGPILHVKNAITEAPPLRGC